MTKTKVKIFKSIYYLLNLITALAICYLGSLVLNTDIVTSLDVTKLIAVVSIIFTIIVSDGLLSYKLYRIDR